MSILWTLKTGSVKQAGYERKDKVPWLGKSDVTATSALNNKQEGQFAEGVRTVPKSDAITPDPPSVLYRDPSLCTTYWKLSPGGGGARL